MVLLIFYDYSIHPYTGYLAKFVNSFKKSRIKNISAFTLFDLKLCKPTSKTESDFIIFYNKHHLDKRYIHIKRSLSCTEINNNPHKNWKVHLSAVKRRFSDLTDLVFKFRLKSESAEEPKDGPLKTGVTNLSYENEEI